MIYGEAFIRRLLCMRSVQTTGWKALFLSANACIVLIASTLIVALIRRSILPAVSHYSTSLDFIFDTCIDRLSGVCSFPTATVLLIDENNERVITTNIAYSLTLDASLVDSTQNRQLGGAFITLLQVIDSDGHVVRAYPKSASFRYRSGIMNRIRRFVLLPFYLIGWTNEVESLHIEYTRTYYDNPDNPSLHINVQIQNRYVEMYDARLTIAAQMGILRSFLFDWPILSSLLMLVVVIICLSTLSMIYWMQQLLFYFVADDSQSTTKRYGDDDENELPDCPQLNETTTSSRWQMTSSQISRRRRTPLTTIK